jgi:hypothetical protein
MFRDMSGMAQTLALAQSALQASAQGATAAGQQAGQNLSTVMANNTERMRIAAQLAGAMGGGAGGSGAGATGSRAPGNVTEEGARLNYARDIDERTAAAGSSAVSPGDGASVSPVFQGSQEITPPQTFESDLFNRQTGGAAEDFAEQALSYAPADAGDGGDGTAIAGPGRSRRRSRHAAPRDVTFTFRFEIDMLTLPPRLRQMGMLPEVEGFYSFIIGAVGGQVLATDQDVGRWRPIPSYRDRFVFKTSETKGFWILVACLPNPNLDPALATSDPFVRQDDYHTNWRRGVSGIPRDPKTYPLETVLRIKSVYLPLLVAHDSSTFDAEIVRVGLRPEDVIYKEPNTDADGNIVSYQVVYLDNTAEIWQNWTPDRL